MKSDRRIFVAAALAGIALAGAPLQAQGYPSKPVMIVVSYPAGGDSDVVARMFAEKLSLRLKQPVIVENRPGASGVVGNTYVARSAPDGHTLLFSPNTITTATMVMKLAPAASYDVLNSFEPVIKTAAMPLVLVAKPGGDFKNVPEMISAAKAGKSLSYASPGSGSPMHILAEWLNREAAVKILHVPYRGIAPSVNDAVAGHVSMAWVTLGPVTQYFNTGKLYPLAIADARRSSLAPNIPTLAELGYKNVVVTSWNGLFAPKGTPAAIVKTLNAHMNEILKQPDVAEKLLNYGAHPVGGAPEELGQTVAAEHAVMTRVVSELGITAE